MDNIKLYYVDGISRENTPYFDGISSQETYFASKAIGQIRDGFYVPHYQDVINLSTADLSFNGKVNYLSLYFNGKTYYYFIDSVDYIDESSVAIRITLDSIQTFMFNINIHDSIIERKFIDRWNFMNNTPYINRNYLRENHSLGVWEEPDYKYISLSDVGLIITRFSTTDGNIINDGKFNPVWKFDDEYRYDTGYEHFTFVRKDGVKLTSLVMDYGSQSPSTYAIGNTVLQKLRSDCANEEVISIAYIPFVPLKNISVSGQDLRVGNSTNAYQQVGSNPTLQMTGILPGDDNWGDNELPEVKWSNLQAVSLSSSNRSTGVAYSSSFIPQMQDSNYMAISFGERSYTASFPVHKTVLNSVVPKFTADIRDGRRIYAIGKDYDDVTFAEGAIVVTDSPIYLTRYTDAWTAWQSRNKFTLAAAGLSFAIQCVALGAGGATVSTITQAAASKAMQGSPEFSDIKYGRYKTPAGYTKYGPRIGRTVSGKYSESSNSSSSSLRYYNNSQPMANPYNIINAASGAANAWLSPDSLKQDGTFSLDMMGSARNVLYTIRVKDFEQVAYHYHRFGYLVRKPFHSVIVTLPPSYQPTLQPFLDTLMSRYYFDYYKFEYVDLDLDILTTDEMVADVEDRLIGGIRVWYVQNGPMCDYQYDNVERSSLQ